MDRGFTNSGNAMWCLWGGTGRRYLFPDRRGRGGSIFLVGVVVAHGRANEGKERRRGLRKRKRLFSVVWRWRVGKGVGES